jgi:enoyl-CoA hydratase
MVSVETDDADGVLVATIDDGKANALTATVIDGVRSAVADASRRGRPLVITGRDGCFSGGFDLAVMRSGQPDLVAALFAEGTHLYRDVVEAPVPIVAACTGHALAGGALLLLAADSRIGRAGPYRIGLNEVAIGMPLPPIAVAMATHRLEPRFLTAATMFAEIGSPERALAMGFFDELADDPRPVACSSAASLAQLPQEAFATTKRRIRRGLAQELAALDRR